MILAGFTEVELLIFMIGAHLTVSSMSGADLGFLTVVMQEASRVRSEMETSSLVGVEQAFFLPLLVFSGVVFSTEALALIRHR